MSLQKYRADSSAPQKDGATLHYAECFGRSALSKITDCRLINLHGEPRATVYITGEADTWYSVPACCAYLGVVMHGFITSDDDGCVVFHQRYY